VRGRLEPLKHGNTCAIFLQVSDPSTVTTAFAVLKDFWAPVLPQHLTICLGLVAAGWHPTF